MFPLCLDRDFRQSIFDEVQMATSLICCCAPLYRSLYTGEKGFWQTIRSWTTRGQGSKSGATTDKSSTAYSHSGQPSSRSFSNTKGRAGIGKNRRDKWVNIDDSVLNWTNVEATRIDTEMARVDDNRDTISEAGSNIPLQSVRIHRTVEVV